MVVKRALRKKTYYITMLIWAILVVIYLVVNVKLPANIEFMPYVSYAFYGCIGLLIFEPFCFYCIQLGKEGFTLAEKISAILFCLVAIIFLTLFVRITSKDAEYKNELVYIKKVTLLEIEVKVYEPHYFILMKEIRKF